MLLGLLLSSCSTDRADREKALASDFLCAAPEGSPAGDLLAGTLGPGPVETTVFALPARLVERVEDDLRDKQPDEDALPTDVCLYQSRAGGEERSARISYQWVPSGGQKERALENARDYLVNGLPARVNEVAANVTFSCVMPGETRELSRGAKLVGWATFTGESFTDSGAAADLRHVTLTYLMAQKAAKVLGCENEPLQGEPVVQPGKG
ncbi:hypothetical protein [Streptomyces fradiae]|uniref:hypothetical protein n=1 Tax=Streptomyces fradiae TaxID=1906 RepID=UPI0029437933|nr:hypothetical protein [Streptomyces fradiae]WOI59201.1 hypothetical protein RYQ63_04315 [Streptomyces fradiae]